MAAGTIQVSCPPIRRSDLRDPFWRWNNLYWIRDESGATVRFSLRPAIEQFVRDMHTRNIILKARQLGFCLDPNTLVLTAELRWVRIAEIELGDALVAVDGASPGGRGQCRRMRTATVEGVREVVTEAYRITLDDGRTVICSGRHRWLTKEVATDCEWRSVEGPGKKGIKVGTKIRSITTLWHDGDVGRQNELFRLLGQTRPSRFLSRRFWEGRELGGKRTGEATWRTVVAIEPLGPRSLIDLQTSTGTFIANGLVSHNSTFILIYILDCLLFKGGLSAAIVAHRLDSAKRLFREKIAFPYNHLPESIRRGNPIVSGGSRALTCAASQELQLANGSSLIADTSVRSGTYQYVHLSEYGPLCADSPVRALEVKTGTLETAHADSVVFIESTAKGQQGHFFELCRDAQRRARDPSPLDALEFKFHFFPWFRNPAYVANPNVVRETAEQRAYFDRVETIMDVTLTPEQRAWYILKKRTQKGSMRSEHPSTPQEAFEAAIQGAYYSEIMATLSDRGQICDVPHMPGYPVHTVWDLGYTTAVWFWQQRGPSSYVIRYHEAQGWGMPQWGEFLDGLHAEYGYRYGQHFAPFDSKTQNGVKIIIGQSILDAAKEAGIYFTVLPMEKNEVREGIPRVQELLPLCYFDRTNCERGLWCLRTLHEGVNMSMSTEDNPVYTGKPADGPECHGADAFRYLSMAVPELDGPSDFYRVSNFAHVGRPQSCMAG